MKINFGHKIAIIYTLFAVGMASMLVMSMQFDHELVTENYYENELKYQGKKDAFGNMGEAPFQVLISKAGNDIHVQFEGLSPGHPPVGNLSLYKPDRAEYDEEHTLSLDDEGRMRVTPRAAQGRYKVSLRFEVDGVDYYVQKEIVH